MKKCAVLTVSLDLELIWGVRDHVGPGHPYLNWLQGVRPAVRALLTLFAAARVPACWAAVGHLFYEEYRGELGRKHPEMPRPTRPAGAPDWYADLPLGDTRSAPLWYGADLIEQIAGCPVAQEIGGHTFSHLAATDPGVTRELFAAELAKSNELAARRGLRLRSLVFPRNRVGHLDVLREHGYVAYRGPNSEWYWRLPGRKLQAAGRLASDLAALTPPVDLPVLKRQGVVEVPHSMFFAPFWGPARLVPAGARVAQGIRGLERAVRRGGVFHIYSHPHNFGQHTARLVDALGAVLYHGARLRDRGDLCILPMGRIAELVLSGEIEHRVEGALNHADRK